jgi:hypothetical protein
VALKSGMVFRFGKCGCTVLKHGMVFRFGGGNFCIRCGKAVITVGFIGGSKLRR